MLVCENPSAFNGFSGWILEAEREDYYTFLPMGVCHM